MEKKKSHPPCPECESGTRLPGIISFVTSGGILLLTCYTCKFALPFAVVRAMVGQNLRCLELARRVNESLEVSDVERTKKSGPRVRKARR